MSNTSHSNTKVGMLGFKFIKRIKQKLTRSNNRSDNNVKSGPSGRRGSRFSLDSVKLNDNLKRGVKSVVTSKKFFSKIFSCE